MTTPPKKLRGHARMKELGYVRPCRRIGNDKTWKGAKAACAELMRVWPIAKGRGCS